MSLSLRNTTEYIATFIVRKDQLVLARPPGIPPGAEIIVPMADTYQVTATAVIDGNTFNSAPMNISGAMGFLAQVLQVPSQGTYEFNVVETPSTVPNQLQFQKTCLPPVTFTISHNNASVQSVVVSDSFQMVTVGIGDTYNVTAVINGITTAPVTTTNPNATITAVSDTSSSDLGYYTLKVS